MRFTLPFDNRALHYYLAINTKPGTFLVHLIKVFSTFIYSEYTYIDLKLDRISFYLLIHCYTCQPQDSIVEFILTVTSNMTSHHGFFSNADDDGKPRR